MAHRADGKPKTYSKPMGPPAINPVEIVGGELVKKCTKCGHIRLLSMFQPRQRKKKHGAVFSECKPCTNARSRRWQASNPERAKKNGQQWVKNNRVRISFMNSLGAALKRRPSQAPITLDQLFDMLKAQGGLCALSGLKMTFGDGLKSTSCSMDRIDQDAGYEAGNIRLVCHSINAMRGRMNDEQFWHVVDMLAARRPE